MRGVGMKSIKIDNKKWRSDKFFGITLTILLVFSFLLSGCNSNNVRDSSNQAQSALPTNSPSPSAVPTINPEAVNYERILSDDDKRFFNKMFYLAKEDGKFIIGADEGEGLGFYQFDTITDMGNGFFELNGHRYYGYGLAFLDYEEKYHKNFYGNEMFLPLNKFSKAARKIVETFEPENVTFYVKKREDELYTIVPAKALNATTTISVKVTNQKPPSLKKANTVLLKGIADAELYVEFVIKGEIFDFKQIELAFNSKTAETFDKRTVKTISYLKDQTVVIHTVEPEGIPIERVTWKSKTGRVYEYTISYNGYEGLDGSSKYFIIR